MKRKKRDALDDIFAPLKDQKKKKKPVKEEPKKPTKEEDLKEWRAGNEPTEPRVHRYTDAGLPVYKFYHLGMAQDDGGTPLCPFDCDCCF